MQAEKAVKVFFFDLPLWKRGIEGDFINALFL